MEKKQDSFISVIAITENIQHMIAPFLTALYEHLEMHFTDYEIVLIDQCSKDGTVKIIESHLTQIPAIRFIRLSSRVETNVAIAAGVENAIGDFVIILNPQTDDVTVITPIVKQCKAGSDIVIGVSRRKQSLGYKLIRPCIQWALNYIDYDIPRNATTLRCLSRRCVNAVTQTGRFHHQLFIRIAKTGFSASTFDYQIKYNDGNSHRQTLRRGITEGIYLVVFTSTKPLRLMSVVGLTGSLLSFCITLYGILIKIFKDNVIEGWTSTVMFLSVLFALLFTILAFFGEYLGRLLDNQSEPLDYAIISEQNSSVMINENRYNVLRDSSHDETNAVQTGRNR